MDPLGNIDINIYIYKIYIYLSLSLPIYTHTYFGIKGVRIFGSKVCTNRGYMVL